MKVSVICVYNNQNQFEEQLVKSLQMQDIDYELVSIDNSTNCFKSAASALNYGASISSGEVLVFSHQDIFLKEFDSLKYFALSIQNSCIGDIVGAVGVKKGVKTYFSNITEGAIFDKQLPNLYKRKLYDVSTVDECFFGMRKETWKKLKYNESICDNWHLYCVEICLHAIKTGGSVYVYPVKLHHFSKGKISLGYMINLKKLCRYYRRDFKYIWTTCYKVRTGIIYINLLFYLWLLKRLFKTSFIKLLKVITQS